MKSWRVKLAGKPYVFGTYPGIVLGTGLTDPNRPSEVGSAPIQSFHTGIGFGLTNGLMQYRSAFLVDPTIPGNVLPAYAPTDVGSPVVAAGTVNSRPKFAYATYEVNNRAFVLGGQHAWQFSPTDPSGGLTEVMVAGGPFDGETIDNAMTDGAAFDYEFSGSSFILGDKLHFGSISTGRFGDVAFTPETFWWVELGTTFGLSNGATRLSYGAGTRNRAFWIGRNINSDAPTLYWAPENPDFPTQDIDDAGVTTIYPSSGSGLAVGRPHVSWLTMVGRSLLVFKSDGTILGADESGILTLAGTITQSDPDPHFGRGAVSFQDGVLIPSGSGLWSFDARTLTLRPASPNYIQNQNEERLRGEITAVGSAGPYAFIGVCGPTRQGYGYMIVRYTNSMAVHDLIPQLEQFEIITDFLPYFDRESAMLRLYYIVFNEDTLAVQVRCKFVRLPSDSGTAEVPGDGYVELSRFPGATPQGLALKLWTQVRGHFDPGDGDADDVSLSFEDFQIDGADVDIAPVFPPEGAFMRPITAVDNEANLVGREMTGKVQFNNPLVTTQLKLPLVFDYIWVPSAANAAVLELLISGEVAGETNTQWEKAPWQATQDLLALRNTVTTLDFPEGTQWNVLVEEVAISDIQVPDPQGQTARVAKVQIRRID